LFFRADLESPRADRGFFISGTNLPVSNIAWTTLMIVTAASMQTGSMDVLAVRVKIFLWITAGTGQVHLRELAGWPTLLPSSFVHRHVALSILIMTKAIGA
jgi:hypothetical protein